jgi:UDP-N-acetylglucosamine acyltransferase
MSDIHKTSVVYDNVKIGKNVYIGPYCIIGSPPEYKDKFFSDNFGVDIGDNTIITGSVTIDGGAFKTTKIGKDCFIMKNVHIGHDSVISDNTTISPQSCIGGHVYIGKNCNIGMNCSIHQYCLIGGGAMIGMSSVITKKSIIIPFSKSVGSPSKVIGINSHVKDKLSQDEVNNIEQEYILEKNNFYYNI